MSPARASGRSDAGRTSRYARYAGGPDPLAPPVDLREALDAIGEDVMAGVSPERAMRELLRQGTQSRVGLDELARQVAQRRRELLQKHQLGGTLDEIRRLLDDAVLAERKQLARDLARELVETHPGCRALPEQLTHRALGRGPGHDVLTDGVERLAQVDGRRERVGAAGVPGVPRRATRVAPPARARRAHP